MLARLMCWSGEKVYYLFGCGPKLVQSLYYGLKRSHANLLERYIKSDVEINSCIRFDVGNWRAVFESGSHPKSLEFPYEAVPSESECGRGARNSYKSPVFTLVVERVEGIQEVISSTIRLERRYEVLVIGRELSNSFLVLSITKLIFAIDNWEADLR